MTTPNFLLAVELTKWPRLLVVGDSVTEEQANDILLRTCPLFMDCNDREWRQTVGDILGISMVRYFRAIDRWRESINGLDLSYLYNERIMSVWIGGPKGWCDWSGRIGCDTYNIGKWPTAEVVDAEWRQIAAAWPFLTLRAQLVPDEGESMVPAVEWRVSGGVVEVVPPGPMLTLPHDPHFLTCLVPGGERGVSANRLREAYRQVTTQGETR